MSTTEKQTDMLCFYVNGKKVTDQHVDPETNLLSYLRDKLRLTGSKSGCGGGGCGACTVMMSRYDVITKTISHLSVNSCLLPVVQLHGAAVTTVEGIGSTKTRIHPVQERIALAHGSQCGFCTPGMVMSVYTLLRNNPHPTMEDITRTLAGNLCRCTGYRPILDGFSTFCQESSSNGNADCCRANGNADCCRANGNADSCQANGNADFCQKGTEYNGALQLFDRDGLLPLDETQELIFPPELILMSEAQSQVRQEFHADRQEGDRQVHADRQEFHGDRGSWVFPVCVEDLLHLKSTHPEAPLVLGNTNIGPEMKFKGVLHPLIISPIRVKELYDITHTPQGVWVGAGNSLSAVQCILGNVVKSLPDHETELYRALLKHLPSIAGVQIRNVASLGGNIVSAFPNSDLNPLLAAGNCKLKVVSTGGSREVPLNEDFFVGFRKTVLKPDDVVLSVFIPRTRKWEIVRSYRQAPRKENAFATVTGAMRVLFGPVHLVTEEISVYYGGVAPMTLRPRMTCDLLIGRRWEEQTFREVYQVLLQDVELPPGSPGGMETFRTSLTLSLMFSFYLDVLTSLKHMGVLVDVSPADCSAIEPLPRTFTPSLQEFQTVPDTQSEQDPVGRPIMHRSAVSQATGEAVYCDDLPLTSGELFMVLVTSTKAHAKILFQVLLTSSDTQTFQVGRSGPCLDTMKICWHTPRSGCLKNFSARGERVSCVGQMICAVVADTKAHAKRGAAAVKIRYEDLPNPIFTLEEAIERKSFFEPHRTIERGNVTEAFHTVHHVYEGQIAIGGQEHFYMETQSMLVLPVGEDNEFKAYVSTQYPAYTQECIAETLAIPSNRVSVHVKRLGGAFGGKVTKTAILASICSVAAYKTGRPVRCVLERGEDMLITGGRHPVLGQYKVGFMNDGRIQAADIQYFTNAGNTIDESLLVVEKIMLHIDSAYNIPHLRGRGVACRTHLPSNTAFRGFGVPQSIMVLENMITDVAAVLGRPAHEVREVNMYSGPSVTHYKFEFDADNLQKCWSECKVRSDYEARRLATEQFNQCHLWRKKGMAMIPIKYGVAFAESFLNQAAALVHIYKDGSVLVSHGGTEMGQGVHTKMQQVASRELHIPLSKVYISETSTNTVPNTCPSAASFGTDANGMAVKNACQTLYQRLEPIRKQKPKGSWESWVNAAFFQKISLSATGFYRGPDCYMNWEQMEGQPYAYFTYGTACCEVELDCLTGDYRTLRTDIVVDIGRSINPSVDIGQIEGAFLQGVGLYTLEELRFSPDGVLLTRGPSQYKIPAVCDAPLSFNVYLLPDVPNPHAIYSSKGIGEPILFLGAAVFYAIKDAVADARRHSSLIGPFRLDSPATPERTCLACQTPFTQIIPTSRGGCSKPWVLNS